jgi:hypothetical protein
MYSSMVTPSGHSCYCADHRFVVICNVCVTGFPAPILATQASNIPVPPAAVNVTELYERLVAAGILPDATKEEEANSIKPVDFSHPETLKL